MIISDIHSHTYYSGCGRDKPEVIIQAAIDGGVQVFGITDHHYGIGERLEQYKAEMSAAREAYKDKIKLLIGVEIATVPNLVFTKFDRLDGVEYILLEHIDRPESTVGKDVLEYRKKFNCHFGIAHTDLISLAPNWGMTPLELLTEFAQNDIFWEMNVSYDSIHGYREHAYYKRFITSQQEQELVRQSGIRVSVGFDGHRVEDYRADRVADMCRFLYENSIPMPEFITSAFNG